MSLDITLIDPNVTQKSFNDYLRACVFEINITHNLAKMADKAGIYEAIWRPEEIGATRAIHIIELVKDGIKKLEKDPEYFRQFDAKNGWGTYNQFIPWLKRYLEGLEENPDSIIEISR